ncbi:uncharacterized protein [Bemisia tabaci]|uniref:uncharacterized protein isoform X1 n=1 Tax=Bemisia tabaci TaxID=7038 RepID=UPI003B27D8E2
MLKIMPTFSPPLSIFLFPCIGLFLNLVDSQPLSSEVENGISSKAHDTLRPADQQLQDASNAFFTGNQEGPSPGNVGNPVNSQVIPNFGNVGNQVGTAGNLGNPFDNRRFWPNSPGFPQAYLSPNVIYTARQEPQLFYYNNSAIEYQGLVPEDKIQYLDPHLYSLPNAKYAKPQPVGYDPSGNLIYDNGYGIQSSPVNYQTAPVGVAGGVMGPSNPFSFGNVSRGFSSEQGFYNPSYGVHTEQDPKLGERKLLRAAVPEGGPVSRARREMPTGFGKKDRAVGRRDSLLKQILGSVGEDFKVQKVGPISLGDKILKREADLVVIQKKSAEKSKRDSHRDTAFDRRIQNSDGFQSVRKDSSFETGSQEGDSEGKAVIRREAKSNSGTIRPDAAGSYRKTGYHSEKLKNRREVGVRTGATSVLPDLRGKTVFRRAASVPFKRKASDILRERIMHWKETNHKFSSGDEISDGFRVKMLQRRAADFKTGFREKSSDGTGEESKYAHEKSSDRKFEERGVNRLRRHPKDEKKCLCTSKVPVNAIVPCDRAKTVPTPRTPPSKHNLGMCTTRCVLNILVPCSGRGRSGLSEVPENAIVASEETGQGNQVCGSAEDTLKRDETSRTEDLHGPDLVQRNSKQEEETGNESSRAATVEKQTSGLAGSTEHEKAQRSSAETEKEGKEQG